MLPGAIAPLGLRGWLDRTRDEPQQGGQVVDPEFSAEATQGGGIVETKSTELNSGQRKPDVPPDSQKGAFEFATLHR
jgi:hypothetical protein